jgi:hypothetical protein
MDEYVNVGSNPIDLTTVTGLTLNVWRTDFTRTTASFVQPAVSSNVTVAVQSSSLLWAIVGAPVYLPSGGAYTIFSIPDPTHIILTNSGGLGNAPVNSQVGANAAIGIVWPASIVSATPPTSSQPSTLRWRHPWQVTDCPAGVTGPYSVQPYLTTPTGPVPCGARIVSVVEPSTPF